MQNNNQNFMKLYTLLTTECVKHHNQGLPVVVCGTYYVFFSKTKSLLVVCSCRKNEHVMDINPKDQSDEAFWKLCLLSSFFAKPHESR